MYNIHCLSESLKYIIYRLDFVVRKQNFVHLFLKRMLNQIATKIQLTICNFSVLFDSTQQTTVLK